MPLLNWYGRGKRKRGNPREYQIYNIDSMSHLGRPQNWTFYVFPFPLHTISFLHTLSLPQLDCLSPPMQGSFVHSHYTVTLSLSHSHFTEWKVWSCHRAAADWLSHWTVQRDHGCAAISLNSPTWPRMCSYLTEQSNWITDVQLSHCTVQLDQLDQGTAAISLNSPTWSGNCSYLTEQPNLMNLIRELHISHSTARLDQRTAAISLNSPTWSGNCSYFTEQSNLIRELQLFHWTVQLDQGTAAISLNSPTWSGDCSYLTEQSNLIRELQLSHWTGYEWTVHVDHRVAADWSDWTM